MPEAVLDAQARLVLDRLRKGPASTLDLQKSMPLVHVAKQIFDLREHGFRIRTGRLPNRVAVYELLTDPPAGAHSCPTCWLPLHSVEPTLVDGYVMGRCREHGRQTVRA